MVSDLIIQGIGFVGVFCFIGSYQIKSNKKLFFTQLLGNLCFCLQFFLLESYSGCANQIVLIARNCFLLIRDKWRHGRWKGWLYVFILLSLVATLLNWQGPISLLPFAGVVASMVGYWTNSAQKIRLSNLVVGSPVWLIYDVLVNSLGGIVNEVITIISILISIKRYGWKEMDKEEFGK